MRARPVQDPTQEGGKIPAFTGGACAGLCGARGRATVRARAVGAQPSAHEAPSTLSRSHGWSPAKTGTGHRARVGNPEIGAWRSNSQS